MPEFSLLSALGLKHYSHNKTNIKYLRGCWDAGLSSHVLQKATGLKLLQIMAHGHSCAQKPTCLIYVGFTVTEAELSAAERLCTGVSILLKKFGGGGFNWL
eukprot:8730775-Pyramimonas_sp.AAC.1